MVRNEMKYQYVLCFNLGEKMVSMEKIIRSRIGAE